MIYMQDFESNNILLLSVIVDEMTITRTDIYINQKREYPIQGTKIQYEDHDTGQFLTDIKPSFLMSDLY